MFRRCNTIPSTLLLLVLLGCSEAPTGWTVTEQETAGREVARALYTLAGEPEAPVVVVWGTDGKPLAGFEAQLDAFEAWTSPRVEVVEVSLYGEETDMMSVPSEALAGMDAHSVFISLAGPFRGSPPSSVQYVCLLPPQWLQAGAVLPGLRGALIPTAQDLPGMRPPENGSPAFRSRFRVFQTR